MPERTKTELQAEITAKVEDNSNGDITAADMRSVLTDLNDSKAQNDEVTDSDAGLMSAADKTKLDGVQTGAQANAGQAYTAAEKAKLAAIEASATADQTGTEIVNAIDAELGGDEWQTPGDGGGDAYTLPHATESTRGGVHGATQIQAEANAGTTVLGWTNTRLRQLLAVALATASLAQAQSVVGTTRLIWTVSRLNEFVSHLLPTATGAEAQSTGNESHRRIWSVQRLKQFLTHNLPTMTQADVDNSTTTRKAATGKIIADNMGGGGGTTTQATETALGVVRGATVAQSEAASGTTILGWTATRLRHLVSRALPTATQVQAVASAGTTRLVWTATRIHQLIAAVLPTVTQVDAEAGTNNSRRVWSPERVRQAIEALGGADLSDTASEGVAEVPTAGTGDEGARWDHEHDIPFNSTLEWDNNAQFGVRVQDVIEHLQEHIQYRTTSSDYSSSAGATVGQAYATSQYRKLITKVEVLLNPLVGADGYLVRLDELNADNSIKAKLFTSQTRSAPFGLGTAARAFNFHDADGDVGVAIDGSIRLGILISRLGDNSDSAVAAIHGSEAANSPRESYDDASVDFELENDVVYQHIDPAIGASTHSHGTDIRGNIKIFYTLILDHGNFVSGGEPGHSPRVDSGNAFPTNPTPVDNDIFIFDEDVASGLDWKDTDETTDLTAATAGDMARFDDPDWIKIINLVGGEVSALTVTETAPDLFLAPIEAVAVGGLGTTGVNKLSLTAANAIVNRGGFTVVSATSNDALQVPEDGTYAIDFSLYMEGLHRRDPFGDSGRDSSTQGRGGSNRPPDAVCQVLPG